MSHGSWRRCRGSGRHWAHSVAHRALCRDEAFVATKLWPVMPNAEKTYEHGRLSSMRIGIVSGWEPRVGAGADGDFILRKPVRTSELLSQVAAEG